MNRMMKIIAGGLVLSASVNARAGVNLIENGDFDSSTGIGASEGTKAVKDGASLAPWKVLRVTNTGLARAANAPTWMLDSNTRTQCGTFAVYMQNASDAADQSIYQDVTVPESGLYRFSAKFIARANGYNGNTFRFSIGGTELYEASTTKTAFWQKFVRYVRIPSPGVYRVEAKCINADKDQMTIFDDFVLEKAEITDGAPETPALVHRYSFNGSWDDAVEGGSAAVPAGDAALDENNETCTMSNTTSGNHNDRIAFGANFLPVNGQATIEIWFTENEAQNWSRLFHTGPGDTDVIAFTLRQGGTTTKPSLRMTSLNGSTAHQAGSMQALTAGTPYYLAVVLKPIQTERGGTTATAYLYNADTRQPVGTASVDARDWFLKDFTQNNFFLGDAHVWDNPDAKMTVDEFRVWNVAFTESMIAASVAAGPDATTLPDPADAITPAPVEEPWAGSATVTVEDSVRGLTGTSAGLEHREGGHGRVRRLHEQRGVGADAPHLALEDDGWRTRLRCGLLRPERTPAPPRRHPQRGSRGGTQHGRDDMGQPRLGRRRGDARREGLRQRERLGRQGVCLYRRKLFQDPVDHAWTSGDGADRLRYDPHRPE